ncbi:hypothetical protein [Mesoplasma seiffertii]|uniref:hypothetical protein n=1 Tax=Mesoplasma seiffertii TaxID=28224 RepID=UPI00047B5556|nr:hypothetical protein [Mesoplasma seiffertii]
MSEEDILQKIAEKVSGIDINDLETDLMSNNSAKIIAKTDSEKYKNTVNVIFTIKAELNSIISNEDRYLGIYDQNPTEEDIKKYLINNGYDFIWNDVEITFNSDSQTATVKAKDKSILYYGSVDFSYFVRKDLQEVITSTNLEISGPLTINSYLEVLKEQNPELDINSMTIIDITRDYSQKESPYRYSATVVPTNNNVYYGAKK